VSVHPPTNSFYTYGAGRFPLKESR
jgi:hypothetical protein